jgi:hypothetical protein
MRLPPRELAAVDSLIQCTHPSTLDNDEGGKATLVDAMSPPNVPRRQPLWYKTLYIEYKDPLIDYELQYKHHH